MTKTGKRLLKAREGLTAGELHPLREAVRMLKERASAKFDETVELAINLGVDPRHADQMVRGVCQLPHGSGKNVRVAVFARGAKAEEAKEAGADIVGAEDLAEEINSGKIAFDRCIAAPDLMPVVGKLGKILGPRGLMPNPRVGSVTPDVAAAVKRIKQGAVEFRVEKAGIVHAGVGRAGFSKDKIFENVRAMIDSVTRAKPSGAKGVYMRKLSISSSQGPGIALDPAEFTRPASTRAA